MVSLAIDPPPSSSFQTRRPSPVRRVLVALALVAAMALGFWLGRVTAPGRVSAPPPDATATAVPAASPTQTSPTPASPTAGVPSVAPSAPTTATATTATGVPPAGPSQATLNPGVRRLVASVNGSLEDSVGAALSAEDRHAAEELTAVVNRLLVWDLQIARDGRKGDRVEVLWSPAPSAAPGMPPSGEPVVTAVRYTSQKLAKVFTAYRFQPAGARFARYYRADGTELEDALEDAPIREYEQVTSLLRDGRRHKGVDFKAPVGSPVFATFDGVVERRNWNFRGNGNCLDVRDPASGRHAIYLHLDVVSKDMSPGRRVKKGEIIAASGNSGHSFAPHLHYQLEDAGGRVLDPFEAQRTTRRAVAADHRTAFDAARCQLDAALNG